MHLLPDHVPDVPPILEEDMEEGRDECGVFGVWAPDEDVAKLTYYGLYALQHRGQEAAGITVSDGQNLVTVKDVGLVSHVFKESTLNAMPGEIAIGHVRYSTAGGKTWRNAQPLINSCETVTMALAHNGNLVNQPAGVDSDSFHILTSILNATKNLDNGSDKVVSAAINVLPNLLGAFSIVFMTENTLYAARDPWGFRPLSLGRLDRGWVVASETSALDIVGASYVRDVEPGEIVAINAEGLTSHSFTTPTPKMCVFEYVYVARPDSQLAGTTVHTARTRLGRSLAIEHPAEADLVIGVPESGVPAAIGYAQQSGIPFGQGFTKNSYVGRTFISPSQTLRQLGIRLKLNPMREVVNGKRLVVVDDSIVRGNTQRAIVKMLREAGAKEVHVRISSPPIMWPCFYGIDFATKGELVAAGLTSANICHSVGADSLGYVSLEALIAATNQPTNNLCTACFTGNYPIPTS